MGKISITILNDVEIKKMREETIRLLSDVGFLLSHEKARKMLEDAGATVDHHENMVKVPPELSEKCINEVPNEIIYAGRNRDDDLIMHSRQYDLPHPRPISGAEFFINPHDGQRRKTTPSDLKEWAILVDALENIDHSALPYVDEKYFNIHARDIHALATGMENSTKPFVMQLYGPKNLQFCIELALAERGSREELINRPRFAIHVSPVSPLRYHANTADQLLLAGEYGIPVEICTVNLLGASAPVTLAGGVVMALAEMLAGVVIHQTSNPGAPIICAARIPPMDMQKGKQLYGTSENIMTSLAAIQAAKEGFGWLINTFVGTDALIPDAQSILETTFGIAILGCSGSDLLSGNGYCDNVNVHDPAILTIQDDAYGYVYRALRGMEVNEETIGVEVIRKVGVGIGKNYLAEAHTLRHFRKGFTPARVLTRSTREEWEMEGSKDLYQKARDTVLSIQKEHIPEPLEDKLIHEFRSIVETAGNEIKESTTA